MKVVVCHPAYLCRLRSFRGRWLYGDNNQEEFTAISSQLVERAEHLVTPRELQEKVATSRSEFTGWVDANLSKQPVVDVLLTPLTRNPFHDLFYATVILRLVSDGVRFGDQRDLLVVTRSVGVMRSLADYAREQSFPFERVGAWGYLLTGASARIRSALKFGRDLLHALARASLVRVMLGDKQLVRARQTDVLIETYLFQGDVGADGTVKHRYFPGLYDWYRNRGLAPSYYPILFKMPIKALPSLYRGYRASPYLYVPLELVCTFSDIVASAWRCVVAACRSESLRQPRLFGVPVQALVAYGRFGVALDGLVTLLMLVAPARMTTRGIRPKWVLDWFENQPFDQANMHGFHLAQPGSRVIGLRLYAQYSSNLMSFQVTNREVNDCLAPSTQWACGKAWLPTATAYDTRATYEVVPALRYAYLYEMEARKTEGSECLVLLTHALPESLRILGAVANVAPIIGFAFSRIQIKPHPVLDAKRCKRTARKHYANLSDDKFAHWVETPMADLLGSARIVISAGTSSAVEAVSLGIPVIIIGASVGIEMCALEFVDQRMWRIAYNEGELIRAIEEWTPFHPLLREIRVSIGEATKLQCFEPKTEASMERFNLG